MVEGQARKRSVILEFPTIEAARACYASPGYQAAKALRLNAADGDIIIVEGYAG